MTSTVSAEYQDILVEMTKNIFPYKMAVMTLSTVMTRRKANERFRESIISQLENGSSANKETAQEMKEMLAGRNLKFWHEKNS